MCKEQEKSSGRAARATMAALGLMLVACASQPEAPPLPPLFVDTAVGAKNLCGLGVSPEIRVQNAPPVTAYYRVRITNTDVLFGQPWEEDVPARGAAIAEGAAKSYRAPCPAQHLVFQHRVEVHALDGAKQPVAYGRAFVPVRALADIVAERSRTTPIPKSAPPADPFNQPSVVPGLLEADPDAPGGIRQDGY